jgi:cytochrome c oxidase subunit III
MTAKLVTESTTAEALATEPAQRSTGWWGMVGFVTTEAALFAVLLGTFFYLRFQHGPQWPPREIERPELTVPLIMTAVLLPSSLPVVWAERGIRRGQRWRLRLGLTATIVMGLSFLSLQAFEYGTKLHDFTFTTDVFGSLFYTITGFHGLHVAVGLLILSWVLAAALRGSFSARHHERVRLAAIYWHFVDAVWVAILFTVYLSQHL